jgi:pilus assembly protein CpaF
MNIPHKPNTPADQQNPDDLWKDSWDAWSEINKSDMTDDELFKWQELILKEFQEIVNKESGQVEVSRNVREAQLTSIVATHKEIPAKSHREIVKTILDDMFSFGPLQELWGNKKISDMQVFVPHDSREEQIITYSSSEGRRVYNGPGFRNYSHAMTWLNRHLARYGQHYDAAKVSKDATFPSGERLHVISGVSGYSKFTNGQYHFVPCAIITLRRFVRAFTTSELTIQSPAKTEPPQFSSLRQVRRAYQRKTSYFSYDGRSIDPATMDYLKVMVKLAKNHLISGGTGSGKSTLANALTAEIPSGTILQVLEESPELQPQNDMHVIRIVQREGVFELHDAMKAALRQYPDRIFIAELRDTLAYTFLRAIQSGQDGSSTTIHSNSCLDAIDVLINFAANHESRPPREMIRDIVFRRVQTVIHADAVKKPNGIARMIDEVVELIPDQTLHHVMRFHKVGINEDGSVAGYFEFTGPTDEFVEEMFDAGIPIPESWGWSE